jgi:hypothetical protein
MLERHKKGKIMSKIVISILFIFANNSFAALPIMVRPMVINRPIVVVLKPEFAMIRFQNIASRFNTSKDVANYFNNNQIQGNFDPKQLNPSQRQVFNQLMADITAHGENFNEDILKVLIQGFAGSNMDIDSMVQWIMFQIGKDSNADLRGMMDEMQNNNKKKREMRNAMNSLKQRIDLCAQGNCGRTSMAQLNAELENLKGQMDSLSDLSEQVSLRLQMMMDRRSKMISTLSNIMKKISETSSSIIQNMK